MTFTALEIKTIVCSRCGCQFGLSPQHFEYRVNFGKDRTIYCPNGHPNYFKDDKELGKETDAIEEATKLRAELQSVRAEMTLAKESLVSLRHRAEQAEAKAAGVKYDPEAIPELPAKEQAKVNAPPTPLITPDGAASPIVRQVKRGYFACPFCDSTYKRLDGHLDRHLRLKHGISGPGAYEVVYAKQGGEP